MDATWFYLDGEQRRGPVTLEELLRALHASRDPHRVSVWREGLPDWQDAGSLPEISGKLPPPKPLLRPREDLSRAVPFDDAEAIARLYRRLVLLVGAQILLGLLMQLLARVTAPSMATGLLGLAALPVLLGILIAMVVTGYKLSSLLGSALPYLWAIGMFVPCINIIVLLALSSQAQTWCRQYGIKVGFFGPTKESIEEVRRRMLTSDFD